jgi:glutathione peroxidase
MKKIDVNGPDEHPIFTYLKSQAGFAGFNPAHPIAKILDELLSKANPDYAKTPDIKWNFTKFLISKDGSKVQRFEPTSTPEEIAASIEALL